MKIPNFIKSVLYGVPVGITIVDIIGYIARVDGISMQPALNPDRSETDYVFLNRWALKGYELKRGDIISLISPKDPSQKIIKRVIGLEGDVIATLCYKQDIIRIPEGHCWIEGDHTGHSMDSNNFGPVSLGLVTAKATCIVWPPSRWQLIESSELRRGGNNMRAISLVNRVEFEFTGNVARKAMILGDIDNDGCNELIVGNQNGEVSIFKGQEKLQTIFKLNFVSCVAVGDIMNQNKNLLIIITADGWCYLYANAEIRQDSLPKDIDEGVEEVDGQTHTSCVTGSDETLSNVDTTYTPTTSTKNDKDKLQLVCVHMQRIPANTKDIVIGDIDGDGNVEMVLGLTDRVVRSYKWIPNPNKSTLDITDSNVQFDPSDKILGKFVALNKWECANQIGSITLHHSADGKPSILIAQPGGTFMRIKCQTEEGEECVETSLHSNSSSSTGENITSSIDYQFLGISRMRNQNISTEILGDLRCSQYDSGVSFDKMSGTSQKDSSSSTAKGKPYALATLDGTIMLVQDEVILWAIAVDHQIFALTKLDVTGSGSDDIVACSWDGETYILDQEKNSVRFHLDEPVQAFNSGYFNIKPNMPDVTCLVYVTFKNTIIIYYDLPLRELTCKKFEPDLVKLSELFVGDDKEPEEALEYVKSLDKKTRRDLVEYLLYNVN